MFASRTRMRSRFLTLALACLTFAGCTIGVTDPDKLPTGPSPQAPRATRLTITPPGGGHILVGLTMPLATSGGLPTSGVAIGAFAQYDNGQGRYVEAAWTSSDETVLAVADNALVARKRGVVTLTATFEGISDTEEFTVDGGFWGRWSGSAVVEQCTASTGSMDDVLCRQPAGGRSGIAPIGARLPFAIEIPETSSEDITARVTLGTVSGVLAGKNRGAGYFSLLGDLTSPSGNIKIVEWNMRAAQDVMEGVMSYQIRIAGVSGEGAVGLRLVNATRQ